MSAPTTSESTQDAARAHGSSLQRLVGRHSTVTLYNGDAKDIMPDIKCDAVVTDPPYGINKGPWDTEFPTWIFPLAADSAPVLAIMPGVWNLLRCPQQAGRLSYRWTLSAYLSNGMTRGAVGYSNWIPCLLYSAHEPVAWCAAFADWCKGNGVTRKHLDAAAGTSDMGGWWASKLAHRCQIPTPEQWQKLRQHIAPPVSFDELINASVHLSDGDSRAFTIGSDDKPDHESPKPLSVMHWIMGRVKGQTICDPFMGSGTTGVACVRAGRNFIGIERDAKHFKTACDRIAHELDGALL